ncbi:DUF481 domain-containing protein [Acidiferrobacter sp.]|uniref:DUF481 domain-containing protein n=1 Tax=Acidiferrobacter sp. TaxID=1872107 RepID=UPI00261C1733|nr:DUF481 domain-containing protein [Acidiferrobacter sp.]
MRVYAGRPQLVIAAGLMWALSIIARAHAAASVLPKPGWHGAFGAGLSSSSGIALTTSMNSTDRLRDTVGLWSYGGTLSYNYFSYNNVVGVNRLVTALEVRRSFKSEPISFVVGSVEYDHNLFDGYDHYYVEMVNAGRRVVATRAMHLDLEAGGGARQNYYPTGRPMQDEPVGDVAMNYVWHLRRGTHFSERVSVMGARSGTLVTSTTGVTTTLIFHLALKFSEQVIHYTSLPSTALVHYARTTTFTTLNLVYHIG